ncbi:TPA: bacteriocin [Candidatus Poribacteria bacterium]|nr:bacteriocin [Candidatus Poribacteria bacterium]
MLEFLARDDSPLSADNWSAIDKVVVESAKKRLIGRKFIDITGPLGVGTQTIQLSKLGVDNDRWEVKERLNIAIPIIYEDFKLNWRDIESAKQYQTPLELGPAAIASAKCAYKEDNLIFNGDEKNGFQGLLNAKESIALEALDWNENGNGFQNVVSAIAELLDAGFYGPYAMIISGSLFALLHRVYSTTGTLEIAMIKELITDGVFQSPILKGNSAVIVATGRENFDLVIAQDLVTAYLGPEGMDHVFRVFESIALRIKRPKSICVFK